ncbi:MAG: aminotransferase class V-fold PLP-dependent enzyme [Streptosporangiales bacterium]|nr:aminotransferase class V-fold PLP-dependent enzyme [Streptosporangiales bacterium]MBO0890922.1 aminotransferase class V-fold PLP-dependent enzyme [Acidothermales bacterium]
MSTTGNAADPASFRAHFPMLDDTVHLASCSQGALSVELTAAMDEFVWSMRTYGAPWTRWMAQVDQARIRFAHLIGADEDEVAIVSCASDGAYQVASTLDWGRRPKVVTTDMEFPSVAHVWLAQQPRGAEVVHVPDHDGVVAAEDYAAAVDERTALVSVPLVSYRNGARMPVAAAVSRARELGARVFVDAYQAAGVLPVDVREIDCDYLVSGALKYLLGVPGLAFLYVRRGTADELAPQLTGWFGRVAPFSFDPRGLDFPSAARRFETGTPSIPAAYGANAGLRLLEDVDPAVSAAHVHDLVDELSERLSAAGEVLGSPADPALRGPQVALVDDDPDALAGWLGERRIVTSPRGSLLRLSFHYYNDSSDVDAVASAIADYRAERRT